MESRLTPSDKESELIYLKRKGPSVLFDDDFFSHILNYNSDDPALVATDQECVLEPSEIKHNQLN